MIRSPDLPVSTEKGEVETASLPFDDGTGTIDLQAGDRQPNRIRDNDIWADFDIDTFGCCIPNQTANITASTGR
ncbi:hypothetical protein MPAR168_04330 [Methylorubrum populi]|uniref:Uncharacterized protein n=1 Tax=Methylobacterium radiotolerans TaxID=31998 RepID=A0ABU7T9Z9_9HYPH